MSELSEPVELDELDELSNSKPRNLKKSLHKTYHFAVRLHVKHASSDPSQTNRQSRRTSEIGGAQLQNIFIHLKLVSGSKPQNPRTSYLHNNSTVP